MNSSDYSERSAKLVALREAVAREERALADMAADMRPMNQNDLSERRAAQVRADEIYRAFDLNADAPREYERPLAYRRRLAEGLKVFGRWSDFKGLSDLPEKEFSILERDVYADAIKGAQTGTFGLAPGKVRMRVRNDSGHEVREFFGHPGSHFVRQFSRVRQRGKVGDINAIFSVVQREIQEAKALKRASAAEHALQNFARRIEVGTV